MYWIVFVACVSVTARGDPMLNEGHYRGDTNEADSLMYHQDDNAHVDIKSDHDLNKLFNYIHKREHGITKEFLFNNTVSSNDFERMDALRTYHPRRCEQKVITIIEKEKYCQLCACYVGQWVCMFATSCYYKYDFSNKMCKEDPDYVQYYDKGCYRCTCEPKTNLMRCVKNRDMQHEDHCQVSKNLDVFRGE